MKPRMILKASMPFLRDRKMEIKSVPPGGGITFQTKADSETVDQTAENTDQQNIGGDGVSRQTVCQKTGEEYDKTGTKREFFADKTKTDINRNGIQKNVDSSIRYCYMKITVKNALD